MKKVAIKVDNEREFNALMKYYEEVKGWEWYSGQSPTHPLYTYSKVIDDRFKQVEFCDNFIAVSGVDDEVIIPFSHLAAIEGIEVEPESIRVELKKSVTCDVYKDRVNIFFDKSGFSLSPEEVNKIVVALKSFYNGK